MTAREKEEGVEEVQETRKKHRRFGCVASHCPGGKEEACGAWPPGKCCAV